MRTILAATLLATVLTAGCAMGPDAEHPCTLTHTPFSMDDQNPVLRVNMLNTGRYCGFTVSNDRRPAEGSGRITEQPAHGQARIRRIAGAAHIQYRPEPGFTGQDSFRATLGPGSPLFTVVATVQGQ